MVIVFFYCVVLPVYSYFLFNQTSAIPPYVSSTNLKLGGETDAPPLSQAPDKSRSMTESFPLDAANQAHQRLRENRMRLRGVLIPD
jgi:hypothetical protein